MFSLALPSRLPHARFDRCDVIGRCACEGPRPDRRCRLQQGYADPETLHGQGQARGHLLLRTGEEQKTEPTMRCVSMFCRLACLPGRPTGMETGVICTGWDGTSMYFSSHLPHGTAPSSRSLHGAPAFTQRLPCHCLRAVFVICDLSLVVRSPSHRWTADDYWMTIGYRVVFSWLG